MNLLSTAPQRPMEILLVEDDPGDALLTERALRSCSTHVEMHVVPTAEEALKWLSDENESTPDLLLLDLNLPGMSGCDLLLEIKTHYEMRRIPVIILSSSRAQEDVLTAYNRHCNAYVEKPGDPVAFERFAKAISDFWFSTSLLPSR